MKKVAFTLFLIVSSCSLFEGIEYSVCGPDLAPVQFHDATICVTYDYYSVNDIRTPLSLPDALEIADSLNMVLPTVEMVDAIYEQADVQLTPITMNPSNEMSSVEYYTRHDQMIDQQLQDLGIISNRLLIAGHKKDLIRISPNSLRVAIYGWHRGINDPIQPYSTVHGRNYYDYSHGVRLVSRTAYINGRPIDLEEIE